jgi:hypothetical protein
MTNIFAAASHAVLPASNLSLGSFFSSSLILTARISHSSSLSINLDAPEGLSLHRKNHIQTIDS